ncbi:hypothetical protein [Solicola gregarius]|uniref:Uncharacterized protein n=1 Tax=Solicola gregarius TaxID=2908642 RepID=A0AA46TGK8_9ACTN|nr:hypothetical protein [Solicola gregarius]UYM04163.1 hypothetical protein L0C25_16655 [Solicola gregarius]
MATFDVATTANDAPRRPGFAEYARFRPFAIVSPGFEQRVDQGGPARPPAPLP